MAEKINPIYGAALGMMDSYAAGTLSDNDCAALTGHMRECPSCAAEYRSLLKLKKLIAAAELPVPDGLHERIMNAVAAERERSAKLARIRRITRFTSIAAGAALVLTIGITGIYRAVVAKTADAEAAEPSMAGIAEMYDARNTDKTSGADIAEDGESGGDMNDANDMNMDAAAPKSAANDAGTTAAEAAGESEAGNGENSADGDTEIEAPMLMMMAPPPEDAALANEDTGDDVYYETDVDMYSSAPPAADAETKAPDEAPVPAPANNESVDNAESTVVEEERVRSAVYAATSAMSSVLWDAPFIDRVNDPEYAIILVGEEKYAEWYSGVWANTAAVDRAAVPLLYAVIDYFDVPRETVEANFSYEAKLPTLDFSALIYEKILTADIIDALYSDEDTMRAALVNEHSLYWDGTIYTYYWLLNNSAASAAPPAEVVVDYAVKKIFVWDNAAAEKLIENWRS